MDYKSGVCNLCGTGCGHFIKTDGKQIYGVVPSQNHPTSRGKLCLRGWHLHELLNTDQRLETPMIRKNGELAAVSWEEALEFLYQKVSAFQNLNQALAVLASARAANEDQYLLMRLARTVFKTNNISIGSEFGHKESLEALSKSFGATGAIGSLAQIENAKYILVIGGEITKMNPIVGSLLHKAKKNGARLVSVESTRTQIAKLSSQHYQPKPGAKGVFVQALTKALEATRNSQKINTLADEADTLKSLGISYKKLMAEAKMIEQAESLVVLYCSGISSLGKTTIDSIIEFTACAGKILHPHSGVFPITGLANLQGSFDMGLVADRGPGFTHLNNNAIKSSLEKTWEESVYSTPGQGVYDLLAAENSNLKALFVVDHDDRIIRHAEKISALDFVVYIGAFENPFTRLAHLVLPSAAFTEYDGTYTATDRRVQINQKKLEPKINTYPAWQIYAQIAKKFGHKWKYENAAQIFFEIANVVPGYKDLSHHFLTQAFGTKPKDLVVSHKVIAQPDNLAKTIAEVDPEYPFALTIGKAEHFWHQNNLMRKTFIPKREFDATLLLYPDGYVEINQSDAKKLGLRNKSSAQIFSKKGKMNITIKISDDVQAGTAYIPYFVKDMVSEFLLKEDYSLSCDEETWLPVKIERSL